MVGYEPCRQQPQRFLGVTEPRRGGAADRFATRATAWLLFIGLYYMAYRYPFQFGGSTSATYADTPPALQVTKYILLLGSGVIIVFLGLVKSERRLTLREAAPGTVFVMIVVATIAAFKGWQLGSNDTLEFGVVIFVALSLTPLARRWDLNADTLGLLVFIYAVIGIAFESLQVGLYLTTGRLPNLAWPGSVSIRFGSTLDDPNSWAVLTALLIPAAWLTLSNRKALRLLTVVALLITLGLTQSFTGVVAVIGSTVFVALIHLRSRLAAVIGVVALLAVISLLAYTSLANSQFFADLLTTKEGSFVGHADSLSGLQSMSFEEAIGFGTDGQFWESTYVSLFYSIGVPLTVAYVVAGVVSVFRFFRAAEAASSSRSAAFFWGYCVFQLAFLVGSINMQFSAAFPLNLLFAMGLAISLFTIPHTPRSSGQADPGAGITTAKQDQLGWS